MNITEYLVAYLRQGKSIEIPGIGTLNSKMEEAHYDSANSTFYPSRRVIEYDNTIVGQSAFLNYIAEKECIGQSTADRLWRNYVDALKEKLEKESSHIIPGIGTLQRTPEGYKFELDEAAVEQGGLQVLRPVSNVKQYTNTKDPFAIFETRFDEVPVEEPEPEVVPLATPIEVAPKEAPEEAAVVVPEPEVEESPKEEITEEPLAEPKVEVATEETIEEESPVTENIEDGVPVTENTEEKDSPVEIKSQEQQATEEETITNEDVVTVVETKEETSQDGPSAEDLKALDALDNMQTPVTEAPRKKKKTIWILLLILILLLLIGGALYYYLMIYKPAQEQNTKPVEIENMISDSEGSETIDTTASISDSLATEEMNDTITENEAAPEEEKVPETTTTVVTTEQVTGNINIFTFNTDGISFDPEEIGTHAAQVKTKMHGYVARYLQSKRTPSALQAMNDSIDQYIDQRMEQLLDGKEYSVARFMNYKDYVREYCQNDIKNTKGIQAQLLVQRELMDRTTLDKMFDQVMASGNFETEAAPATKKVTMNDMKTPVKVPAANIQTNSKRGFDVIAGFFSNKNNAQVLTANLKRQGCDAYIIQKGEFYYVSMGSADSRTKAESLYNHLKEWYDGDMVIKKW